MAFGYDAVRSETVVLSDPGADGTFLIWRAPSRAAKVEIIEAWGASDTEVKDGAGTAFTLRLADKGAAGTSTISYVSATLGAAGTGDWSANVPRAFTISEGTLDGGDYLAVVYDETGTVAPKNITIGFSWVSGVGA